MDKEHNSHKDLESSAGAIIGRIVFAFSRFEFNLDLCLRNTVSGNNVELVNPLLERLTFKSKIDAMFEVIKIKFKNTPECVSEFKEWHGVMDKLRTKRNNFVHGRWWTDQYRQQIIHVTGGLPTSVPLPEIRYTIIELENEFTYINKAIEQFYTLRKQWYL